VTKTVLIVSLFALASGAYPSTISSFSISTDIGNPFPPDPCSISGSGTGSAACSSTGIPGSNASAVANVTVTDNSIQLFLGSRRDSGAVGFASITHDDFYAVPVNGPVSALVNLVCDNGSHIGFPGVTGHFSLGSSNVSPPVELIYTGASQGSGPCGGQYVIGPPTRPPDFTGTFNVSLSAINNIVHLHTYIDGSGSEVDDSGGIFVQLTVDGFQDSTGNPITATLLPEPGTLGTFGLALLVGAGIRRRWPHRVTARA
jgi:hypothetical protein